jgi:DNA-binding protein HU-beta
MFMTRDELVEKIATDADISKAAAALALKAVTAGITGALAGGGDISLVGFGTFSVTDRAARVGRNPQTGEALQIAASKGVKFKAGKAFKDAVK